MPKVNVEDIVMYSNGTQCICINCGLDEVAEPNYRDVVLRSTFEELSNSSVEYFCDSCGDRIL